MTHQNTIGEQKAADWIRDQRLRLDTRVVMSLLPLATVMILSVVIYYAVVGRLAHPLTLLLVGILSLLVGGLIWPVRFPSRALKRRQDAFYHLLAAHTPEQRIDLVIGHAQKLRTDVKDELCGTLDYSGKSVISLLYDTVVEQRFYRFAQREIGHRPELVRVLSDILRRVGLASEQWQVTENCRARLYTIVVQAAVALYLLDRAPQRFARSILLRALPLFADAKDANDAL